MVEWQNPKNFLVVVAAKLNIQTNSESLLVEMGSHLSVIGKQGDTYIVKLPRRQGMDKFVLLRQQCLLMAVSI